MEHIDWWPTQGEKMNDWGFLTETEIAYFLEGISVDGVLYRTLMKWWYLLSTDST